jgi:hypothetical protein
MAPVCNAFMLTQVQNEGEHAKAEGACVTMRCRVVVFCVFVVCVVCLVFLYVGLFMLRPRVNAMDLAQGHKEINAAIRA